jgi:TRAP-type C4-dicarboxylate transport system permease small subunit
MQRLLAAATRAAFALACAALVVMLCAYVAEVVLRYFFDAPTRWASDVVAYAMLCLVALAMPAVTQGGGHVAITSVVERLPAAAQPVLAQALAWVCAAACAAATALMAGQAWAQLLGGIETVAALPIPKAWLSGAVALGFGLSAAEFAALALARRGVALGGEREI